MGKKYAFRGNLVIFGFRFSLLQLCKVRAGKGSLEYAIYSPCLGRPHHEDANLQKPILLCHDSSCRVTTRVLVGK